MRDRLSFRRFLGLRFEDGVPDGTTLWLFREKLAQAGVIDKLFERRGGQTYGKRRAMSSIKGVASANQPL